MYWQKRFDRVNPNKELDEKILAIHEEHKNFPPSVGSILL